MATAHRQIWQIAYTGAILVLFWCNALDMSEKQLIFDDIANAEFHLRTTNTDV
jgi:hypothetical protein